MSRSVSNTRARRFRLVGGVAGIAMLGALVAGCGPDLAGSAAVIGETRITDQTLTTQSDLVTEKLGIEGSAQVNAVLLQRLITQELVNKLAAREGVVISQGEIDSFLAAQYKQAGGQDALAQQLLQSGIPGEAIQDAARTTLQVKAIGAKLAPNLGEQAEQAAVGVAIIEMSKNEDTRVSPRFGAWDGRQLQVVEAPNDLSEPALTPNSGIAPMPQPR